MTGLLRHAQRPGKLALDQLARASPARAEIQPQLASDLDAIRELCCESDLLRAQQRDRQQNGAGSERESRLAPNVRFIAASGHGLLG